MAKFFKGQEAWNKGTVGVMKANATSFKKGLAPKVKFPKGHKPWNAGTRKIGVCVTCGNEFKMMQSTATHCSRECLWNDAEWKKKINERKKCPRPNSQGKKRPSAQGENHYRWVGENKIDKRERHATMSTLEYREWRKSVFKRDNYLCAKCGNSGHINAHHIKPYAKHPELRLDVNNGITYCVPCHKEAHRKRG